MRTVATVLVLLLLSQFAPSLGATGAAGPDPVASNPRTGATYFSIQAALDAAVAGDTITVVNSSATPAAAYAGPLTLSKNGVTLCATLALNVCAADVADGRWNLSQPNTAAFADPPVPFQGAAIHVSGGPGSTSFFPNAQNPLSTAPKLHVSDVAALSFDMLLEPGNSCASGGPRVQFGVDTDGDGVKDAPATLSIYPASTWTCPASGAWSHVDLMGGRWVHSVNGGGTTRASAASHYGTYPVVSINLIWEGTTSAVWYDNERVNDHVFREAVDQACVDPESPSCSTDHALPKTILDGGIVITGNDVTVTGFTIRDTDVGTPTHYVRALSALGTGARILGNVIDGNGPRAVASVSQSPEFGAYLHGAGFVFANNTVTNWAHTGVYVSAGPGIVADNLVNKNRGNALYLEDGGATVTIVRNDLTQTQGANIRVDARPFIARDNTFGVSQFTIDFNSAAAPVEDARQNHWGAFNRSAILATIHEDAPGHSVNIDCYYGVDGAQVCPPTAAFTASTTTPARHALVAFTDASAPGSRPTASHAWTFGDGATSAATSPSHAYANPGVFTVTETVADDEGGATSASRVVSVSNTAPTVAAIPAKATSEGANLAFTVVGSDADGDALAYTYAPLVAGANLNAATGLFSWTPSYAQAGPYDLVVTVSDGAATATTPVHIDVANVDRAPIVAPIADVLVIAGAPLAKSVAASDADGDAVALTTSALPAWLSFVDGGSGSGTFSGTPAASDAGATLVTVTATANGLTGAKTFRVTVALPAAFTLERVGAFLTHASPGETVTLDALLTNAGSVTDTYALAFTASGGWTVSGPASVTLAPGASTLVTATLTVPVGGSTTTVTVKAVSGANPTVSRVVSRNVDVPMTVTLTLASAAPTILESVHGVVKVTWADGTPVANAPFTLTQTSQTLAAATSAMTGHTLADGTFAFDFGADAAARLPGSHTLRVVVGGPLPAAAQTSYAVGVA